MSRPIVRGIMKVKFIGNPADPKDEQKVCEMFGLTFFRDIATDVSDLDEHARRKLGGNRHFEVVRGPGRPKKEEKADGGENEERIE